MPAPEGGAAGRRAGPEDPEDVVRATVNGVPVELAAGTTVDQVVAANCRTSRGIAVALDREVVPRSAWPRTAIAEGARVEIVTAAAGG